jgi:hypothetical protein
MQLTRFDRWLLEEFVHETHIYTLSAPASVPPGIKELPKPDAPGTRFQHHFVAKKSQPAEALIGILKDNGQMFSTQVIDRRAWYVPIIAPHGKSITWRAIWIIVTIVSLLSLSAYLKQFLANPELRQNVIDAIKTLRG